MGEWAGEWQIVVKQVLSEQIIQVMDGKIVVKQDQQLQVVATVTQTLPVELWVPFQKTLSPYLGRESDPSMCEQGAIWRWQLPFWSPQWTTLPLMLMIVHQPVDWALSSASQEKSSSPDCPKYCSHWLEPQLYWLMVMYWLDWTFWMAALLQWQRFCRQELNWLATIVTLHCTAWLIATSWLLRAFWPLLMARLVAPMTCPFLMICWTCRTSWLQRSCEMVMTCVYLWLLSESSSMTGPFQLGLQICPQPTSALTADHPAMPPLQQFQPEPTAGALKSPLKMRLVLLQAEVSLTLSMARPQESLREVPSKERTLSPELRVTLQEAWLTPELPVLPKQRESRTKLFQRTLPMEVSQGAEPQVLLTAQSNSSLQVRVVPGKGLLQAAMLLVAIWLNWLLKVKYCVISQLTFPSSSHTWLDPLPQALGPYPISMPVPCHPLMSLKMPHEPQTLGAEKSPLITMLAEVPCLTSWTLSISRPQESEIPAPTNWSEFLPGWTVTARVTGVQVQSLGTTLQMMALLKTTSPRQLLKATPGLQAYWKERVNWLEREPGLQLLGGGVGRVMTGGKGATGTVVGTCGGREGGVQAGGATTGMTGVGGVTVGGATTDGGVRVGTSMQGALMVGTLTGGGAMTGGVTVGMAHAGGAIVGAVTTTIGWLTGTDPPVLGHPSQVHPESTAETSAIRRMAKIALFICYYNRRRKSSKFILDLTEFQNYIIWNILYLAPSTKNSEPESGPLARARTLLAESKKLGRICFCFTCCASLSKWKNHPHQTYCHIRLKLALLKSSLYPL